jgi:hypothetical protein
LGSSEISMSSAAGEAEIFEVPVEVVLDEEVKLPEGDEDIEKDAGLFDSFLHGSQ